MASLRINKEMSGKLTFFFSTLDGDISYHMSSKSRNQLNISVVHAFPLIIFKKSTKNCTTKLNVRSDRDRDIIHRFKNVVMHILTIYLDLCTDIF